MYWQVKKITMNMSKIFPFFFALLTLPSIGLLAQVGCISGDCYKGEGTFHFEDDSKYTGGFKNGVQHGHGTYTWESGRKYEGDWESGLYHGFGVMTYPDGNSYSGNWIKGSRNGLGTYIWGDGHIYVGNWSNDMRNGYGKFTYPDGYEQVGQWKDEIFIGGKDDKKEQTGIKETKKEPSSLGGTTVKIDAEEKPDLEKPKVFVTSPTIKTTGISELSQKNINIEGYATDNQGIKVIRINGYDAVLTNPTSKRTEFSSNLSIKAGGTNEIWIEVRDLSDNVSRNKYTVKLKEGAQMDDDIAVSETKPKIVITSPSVTRGISVVTKKNTIEVKGYVIDKNGVRSVRVGGFSAFLSHPNSAKTDFNAKIELAGGQNQIWVEATDRTGAATRENFTIDYQAEANIIEVDGPGENHLLVIGINDYQHWGQLYNAVKDAQDIRTELSSRYDFDEENITFLYNSQATEKNIILAFKQLISKVEPNDNVLIYFSGHGYYDKILNEGYWIPVMAKHGDESDYISNAQLQKFIRQMDNKHTFLIADACFSGSMLGDRKGFVENVGRFKSRRALVSGRLEVVSDGERGKNSPFADAVLTYLRNHKNGAFAASQLEQYVKITVANNSEQTPQHGPIINVGDKGGEFIFKLK